MKVHHLTAIHHLSGKVVHAQQIKLSKVQVFVKRPSEVTEYGVNGPVMILQPQHACLLKHTGHDEGNET